MCIYDGCLNMGRKNFIFFFVKKKKFFFIIKVLIFYVFNIYFYIYVLIKLVKLWKSGNINLQYLYFNLKFEVFNYYRLILYGCLSIGKELGFIECVRDVFIIMDIQSKIILGVIQINFSNFYRWIKDNNKEK